VAFTRLAASDDHTSSAFRARQVRQTAFLNRSLKTTQMQRGKNSQPFPHWN